MRAIVIHDPHSGGLIEVVQSALRLGRHKTRDEMFTYDVNPFRVDDRGNAQGKILTDGSGRKMSFRTSDGNGGFRTVDSTGAFLVGELERLDQTLHEPLTSVSWGRDIDLREDVTLADEVSSFTRTQYGSAGGLGTGNGVLSGKAWIGKNTDQVTGIGLDLDKNTFPLNLWAMELKYTIPELESAAKTGRSIDQQKYAGLQLKHQMDIDEQVYVGDTPYNITGLQNNANVSNQANVASSGGVTAWAGKTPDDILADVNEILTSTWAASAWAQMPSRLLLPPAQFGLISTMKVSTAGNVSVLKYIQDNSILTTSGRGKLEIFPLKWLIGAGTGGTLGTLGTVDRMIAYTKDKNKVRFPMTLLQRTPVQYDSLYHKTTYFCRLGAVEVVYPETLAYRDGI
jgi:hypothetical protein